MGKASWGVLLCVGVGLLLLVLAVREAVVVRRLRRRGIRTHGVVIDNVRVRSDESTHWVPIIEFVDRNGHRVEFRPRMQGAGMGLATGRRVDVVYPAHNPQAARVGMWRHTVGPVVFMMFVGVVFLGTGIGIALWG